MQVESASPATRRPAGWKLALNLALLVGLVGIFAWQAKKSWPEVQSYLHSGQWHWNWGFAGAALLLLLLCSAIDIFIWNRTLGWFTDSLPFRKVAPLYIWSFMARYLPGKVGSLLLRVALATEVQRAAVPVLAASTVELALRIASGLLLFLAALLGWGFAVDPHIRLASIVAVPLVLICAHPRVMMPVMNWGLKKIKQQPMTHCLRYRDVLGIFAFLFLRWMVYGIAYALLAAAIFPGALSQIPVLIGTAAGAWAAGFVFMTPGGVGTAELVQNNVLTWLAFPPAIATILPVLARLWTLIGEGLWSAVGWWMRRSWQREEEPR